MVLLRNVTIQDATRAPSRVIAEGVASGPMTRSADPRRRPRRHRRYTIPSLNVHTCGRGSDPGGQKLKRGYVGWRGASDGPAGFGSYRKADRRNRTSGTALVHRRAPSPTPSRAIAPGPARSGHENPPTGDHAGIERPRHRSRLADSQRPWQERERRPPASAATVAEGVARRELASTQTSQEWPPLR